MFARNLSLSSGLPVRGSSRTTRDTVHSEWVRVFSVSASQSPSAVPGDSPASLASSVVTLRDHRDMPLAWRFDGAQDQDARPTLVASYAKLVGSLWSKISEMAGRARTASRSVSNSPTWCDGGTSLRDRQSVITDALAA